MLTALVVIATSTAMSNSALLRLVPMPSADSVNTGVSPLHQRTVLGHFGAPRTGSARYPLYDDGPITNPKLLRAIVTESVGPFRVTGHRRAIASLRSILAKVRAKRPDLYALLGTAGMLCCRMVRGSATSWSNHAFGFGVDVTLGGQLDVRGDGRVQAGLTDLYAFFHAEGWFWGVEFGVEDGMHLEPGDELVRRWIAEGEV